MPENDMTNLYDQQPCERFAPLISAMIDGELESTSSLQLEEHMNQCDVCRRRAQAFKEIDELIFREAESMEAPRSIPSVSLDSIPRSALLESDGGMHSHSPVSTKKFRRRSASRWTKWIPLAVAATILIGLMMTTFPSQRSTVTAEQIAKPLAELELIEVEYHASLDRMLDVLKLDLRALKVELAQLGDAPDASRNKKKKQLQDHLDRLIEQVKRLETKTDPNVP